MTKTMSNVLNFKVTYALKCMAMQDSGDLAAMYISEIGEGHLSMSFIPDEALTFDTREEAELWKDQLHEEHGVFDVYVISVA